MSVRGLEGFLHTPELDVSKDECADSDDQQSHVIRPKVPAFSETDSILSQVIISCFAVGKMVSENN